MPRERPERDPSLPKKAAEKRAPALQDVRFARLGWDAEKGWKSLDSEDTRGYARVNLHVDTVTGAFAVVGELVGEDDTLNVILGENLEPINGQQLRTLIAFDEGDVIAELPDREGVYRVSHDAVVIDEPTILTPSIVPVADSNRLLFKGSTASEIAESIRAQSPSIPQPNLAYDQAFVRPPVEKSPQAPGRIARWFGSLAKVNTDAQGNRFIFSPVSGRVIRFPQEERDTGAFSLESGGEHEQTDEQSVDDTQGEHGTEIELYTGDGPQPLFTETEDREQEQRDEDRDR
jgi:hypothetical protein